jgi:hypothetical protein
MTSGYPSSPPTGAPPSGFSDDRSAPDVSDTTVGQLLAEISRDFSTLMRQEVELAKAEIKAEATRAGKGAGLLGGSGYAGHMVLLFLSFAAWWGLANVMDTGIAALIVAVVWLIVGVVLFSTGRAALRQVNPKPERTVATAKHIPEAFKGQ